MAKINKTVESLLQDAKIELNVEIQDRDAYSSLIKDLLVQGLIKLIEPTVLLKVRQSDLELVRS